MRRVDTHWRDPRLAECHAAYGFDFPLTGMPIPMIEYDRGEPRAILSYQSRGFEENSSFRRGNPQAVRAYRALGGLSCESGDSLPFLTVEYDARNWAYRLFPHNQAARTFLDVEQAGWVRVTERYFSNLLYRMRGRVAPDLTPYGVEFADSLWLDQDAPAGPKSEEAYPGQSMSRRRRDFEPVYQVRMAWRNPCLDIDFAVVDVHSKLSLLVDYKAPDARVGLGSTNLKALSGLYTAYDKTPSSVPAMLVRYLSWEFGRFRVYCLNSAARNLLSYALGDTSVPVSDEWVSLSRDQWFEVLNVARNL